MKIYTQKYFVYAFKGLMTVEDDIEVYSLSTSCVHIYLFIIKMIKGVHCAIVYFNQSLIAKSNAHIVFSFICI